MLKDISMTNKLPPYTSSIHFELRLCKYDIAGSVAHAKMLGKQKIISKEESVLIIGGLEAILLEIDQGDFQWRVNLEDIHMNIEARLYEKIGDTAGKLHTARSRNDQIATDMRLYTKDAIKEVLGHIT